MKKINFMVTGALLLGCLSGVNAENLKSKMGNIPLGNVSGSTGNVFPKGKSRVVLKHMSVSKDSAYNGDDEVLDAKKRKFNVDMTHILYRYGLGSGFDIRVATSYVQKKQTQTIPMGPLAGTKFDLKNSGLGDSKVIVRYELLNQMKGAPLFLAVGAGLKLPTGSTNKSFDTPMGQKQSNQTQPMQLGSGSYDYITELGATKFLPNSRIDAHMMYVLTTEGKNDYEFGDKFKWNLGYSYAINKYFDVQLELDGVHLAKNKYLGGSVDYSGGNFMYITPGIHIIPSKKYDISVGYSYMISRDNNYDALSNTAGLSEDYRLIFRVGYNF
ncbi:hypothetical protein N8972_02370 [Sulfurospirillum sp.]|nr:hypothetical protein [Sulfurospirillum sp.]